MVDLVLSGDGSYWRKRVELPSPPPRGQAVLLAPEVVGVVVGSSTPFEDDGSVAAVLLRAEPAGSAGARSAVLRADGWRALL